MDMIVIAALGLLAFAGAILIAWGMWLEHRRAGRILDLVAAAIEQGREPPGDLLAALVEPRPALASNSTGRQVRRTAVLFLIVAAACLLGSWAVGEAEREQALLLVASMAGLTGVGLLVMHYFGRRFGL